MGLEGGIPRGGSVKGTLQIKYLGEGAIIFPHPAMNLRTKATLPRRLLLFQSP